ncbi:MAG TPA: metal-dependent hydrolase [Sphingomicrobium sp.]|nr:metal-dependent hydrolase [Sphingomicrobium sp.]
MDNLTHSLVGAVMGRMGLQRLSPRAMPAMIVAANLPDVDSFVAKWLGTTARTFHRGFTHGIGGMLTMPFLAVAIIWAWEKLRPGKQGSIKLGGLLVACFVAVLSHPALDFLNTYGVRLLEPFSHRWFYGDTLFIVDPWIWIMLILGLEFSWRAERLGRNWQRPATYALLAVLGYIGLNVAISVRAVAATRPLVEHVGQPTMVVAGEIPLEFWKRQVMWRTDRLSGTVDYEPFAPVQLGAKVVPLNLEDPRLLASERSDPVVCSFLFWSRMPLVLNLDGRAYLSDQRFPALRRTTFMVPLDKR